MVTKLSLLVHAGAPSKRSDDDRTRVLAEAYLGFTGRVISEQTYRIPELAVSQQLSQHNHEPGNGNDETNYPTQLLRSSPPAGRIEDDVSMSVVQPAYDDTTFLEDTQDAYAALESQLQTSSLGIPDVTPLKRRLPESFDPDSSWPEDLDGHSPVKGVNQPFVHDEDVEEEQQSQQISVDEVFLQQSQQVSPEQNRNSIAEPVNPVVERPAKKARLQQRRIPAPPVFKPFQPPLMKRAVTDVTRAITPEVSAPVVRTERKSVSQTSESQDSYLKTPILVTPSQGWAAAAASKTKQSRITQPRVTHTQPRNQSCEPPPRPVPYISLPEDDGVGLAYISEPPNEPRTPGGERHSQYSGSAPDTTSELPTSYSLSDITSQSSRARARLRESQRSVSDPGKVGGGGSGEGGHLGEEDEVARASAQLGKQQGVEDDADLEVLEKNLQAEEAAARPKKKTTAAGPPRSMTTPQPAPVIMKSTVIVDKVPVTTFAPLKTVAAKPAFHDLSLTIRPPDPEVAIENFTTHITPTLSYLSSSPQLAEVYTPISVSRPLLPLERGYWLIDPAPWPTEAQIAFWKFLESKVGTGQAGWGVWCLREGDGEVFGKVQVFCWGEVVKHVYLMLYVASTSRVRKIGLRWVDGEGEVVVQMRGGGAVAATING
ncbi:hypothetical protein LTS10_010050 [Elasticomyces elasticus]|nr:hypothetical protein LTS10_010050 [Elasticomyces elasticus]